MSSPRVYSLDSRLAFYLNLRKVSVFRSSSAFRRGRLAIASRHCFRRVSASATSDEKSLRASNSRALLDIVRASLQFRLK